MNPVTGHTMLNFLHWIATHHPEIRQLEKEPMERLLMLVDEFEGGKLRGNPNLRHEWRKGFSLLFMSGRDREGYGVARQELRRLEYQGYEETRSVYGGARPVNVYAMIDFLRWLRSIHPEIRQLKTLHMGVMLRLVGEYHEMSNREEYTLDEWESSFQILFDDIWVDEHYWDVRRLLRYLEMRIAR